MKTQFQLTLEPALVARMRCSLIAGSSRGSALTLVEVPSLASQSEALSALTLLPGALTCPRSHPGAFSWNMPKSLPVKGLHLAALLCGFSSPLSTQDLTFLGIEVSAQMSLPPGSLRYHTN